MQATSAPRNYHFLVGADAGVFRELKFSEVTCKHPAGYIYFIIRLIKKLNEKISRITCSRDYYFRFNYPHHHLLCHLRNFSEGIRIIFKQYRVFAGVKIRMIKSVGINNTYLASISVTKIPEIATSINLRVTLHYLAFECVRHTNITKTVNFELSFYFRRGNLHRLFVSIITRGTRTTARATTFFTFRRRNDL